MMLPHLVRQVPAAIPLTALVQNVPVLNSDSHGKLAIFQDVL